MISRKNQPVTKKSNDFYWEGYIPDSKLNILVVVQIKTISINKTTEGFYKDQNRILKEKIKKYFKINRIHINEEDTYNNLILGLISQYPPTHLLLVGYRSNNKEIIKFKIFFSLEFLKQYNMFSVIRFLGRFIVSQICQEKTGFFLVPNEENEEYYLQLIRATCKSVLSKYAS